jgi:MOSC domain-containing protein YiiM
VRVVSVNTGAVRPLRIGSRNVPSGIGKTAVIGPVPVMPLGLLGDE